MINHDAHYRKTFVHRKNFVHVGNEEVGKNWRVLENPVLVQSSAKVP